jgi:transposase
MVKDIVASMMFALLREGESVTSVARRLRMGEKTIRKYRDANRLPSQIERPVRTYRTRQDPLEDFWGEIAERLEEEPRLKPYAILDWLKQKYNPPAGEEGEDRVTDSIRRTLERRVQQWKLEHGVEQEVTFPQVHHPGDVIAFDFVVMNALKVTIGNKPFEHLMFHAVFTYSNWEYVHLCHSESFEALSAGLQDALHHAGGVPRRVRSDSLSAAVKNLSSDREFATQYRQLLEYYGVEGHRINVRKPQENGDVESSHGHFKDALDQALRLRGSRDFDTVDDFMTFTRQLTTRRNMSREQAFLEEVAALSPLPPQRRSTCTSMRVTVKSDSVIHVKRNTYSVSSKYIGLELEVRIHQDHLELWYRHGCLERIPRQFGCGKEAIDFRHVIDSLVRKPGAFLNYRYVNHMYPTTRFRMAYDQLLSNTTEAAAVKQYLKLLHAAKHEGLDLIDDILRWFFTEGKAIRADEVLSIAKAQQQLPAPTDVHVDAPDLSEFDSLLQHKDVYDDKEVSNVNSPPTNDQDEVEFAAYDRHVEAAGSAEGLTTPDVSRAPCDTGGPGGPRAVDTHSVSGAPSRAGMSVQTPEPHRPLDARCQPAGGKDLGGIPVVSSAAACDAAIRDTSPRELPGSPGQRVDLWTPRLGENDAPLGVGGSTREARSTGLFRDVPDAGPGAVACQTGPSLGASDQEAPQVRSIDHRRLGVRPTKSRGDGGPVHVVVGEVRTWQCPAEFESSIFQVGADLQGPNDDRSRDRSIDPSLRHHRTDQDPELPTGRSQEEPTRVHRLNRWLGKLGGACISAVSLIVAKGLN